MLPTLHIGPWHLVTYHVMGALALLVAGMYSFHRLLQVDCPPEIIVRGLMLTILGGVAGALLVSAWPYLQGLLLPNPPPPVEGIFVIWMLIGGFSTAIIYCRWHRIPLGRSLDMGLLPAPLGLAIGRLGCFGNGCCYGRLTDSWLGVYLPDIDGVWAVRYPTQLMSSATDFFIFLTLLAVERYGQRRVALTPPPDPLPSPADGAGEGRGKGWPFDGFLALLFLNLYCLKRFLIDFLRASSVPVLGPLGAMQVYALAGLVVSTALIVWNLDRRASTAEKAAQQAAPDGTMQPPSL